MPTETMLTPGETFRINDTTFQILAIKGDRVEFAISFPEHVTVRIPDPEDSLPIPATS